MKAKPAKPAAKVNKPKVAAKTAVKAAVKAAIKTVVKSAAKPAKATAKAAAKVIAKAAKPTSKPVPKPASKAVVKPKATPKPAAKPAPKKATTQAVTAKKPVPKPAQKSAARAAPVSKAKKPLVKVPAKSPVKVSAKPVSKSAPKVLPTSAAKPIAKPGVKGLPKPPAKGSAKVAPPALVKPAKPPKPEKIKLEKALPTSKKIAPAPMPTAAPKPAALAANGLPPPPPLKPGRRSSSRALAHMPPPAPMVPTHAPDAAKASYSTMTERVIAPPPHVAAKKDPKLANNWKTKTAETLTEDEVKAMPDAEYMNELQMAFFRRKLAILKQDIHNSAGATTEHLREDTAVVPDPADRATIEEEHALELRTRDRERKLLKKIEQSIARIDSGDYGYCDETGEPIGVGRLIARPTASLSLEAQQRRELKQKMFGD